MGHKWIWRGAVRGLHVHGGLGPCQGERLYLEGRALSRENP